MINFEQNLYELSECASKEKVSRTNGPKKANPVTHANNQTPNGPLYM